jgi:DNA-directed RNA polymerase subunit M/transcription elongation factor TFIIS
VRASDFTYTVVYPDGRESTILHVPHYSYHFQLAYALATPLTLPAGSKLIVTAHYDNSPTNEQLRHLGTNEAQRKCGPDHVAYFTQQNQSWDEMFTPLVQYSVEPGPGTPLPLVTAVGCLVPGRTGGWGLEHGSAPQASDTQGTSSAELRASAAMPLGSARYQLLGVDGFDPSSHAGSRVVVKGVLIPAGGAARLNVTSLQSTSSTCPP